MRVLIQHYYNNIVRQPTCKHLSSSAFLTGPGLKAGARTAYVFLSLSSDAVIVIQMYKMYD